jgi:signal transduction histidine kinase
MNEDKTQQAHSSESTESVAVRGSTIRSQLIWASLFPLAFFGLLSTLVTASALNQLTLNLVTQRNTAQAQTAADSLASDFTVQPAPTNERLYSLLQSFNPVSGSRIYLIDFDGNLIASSEASLSSVPLKPDELSLLIKNRKPASQLMESSETSDSVVVSFAPLPGEKLGVILEEPWQAIMSPAFYYQLLLVALLALGTILSLVMLSLSIQRVIRPIAKLAEDATGAVPGSIFRPVPDQGPLELRILIKAFNQMVIRLAEQQSVLRQYAHKALLSQEEERQRLSHELHDGTLQDMVGLAQRVELCRTELERDPHLARNRLDELHGLVEKTISDVRRISNALRPSVLEDLGLSVALDTLCKDLKQYRPALQCEYIISGQPRRLLPDLELAVYRVVQEAIANIRKHALDATLVQVELNFNEAEIQAIVRNNAATFANPDVRSFVRSGHLGLAGMYERARLFGGTLDITSDLGGNTVVSLQLPYA